VNKAGSELV